MSNVAFLVAYSLNTVIKIRLDSQLNTRFHDIVIVRTPLVTKSSILHVVFDLFRQLEILTGSCHDRIKDKNYPKINRGSQRLISRWKYQFS